MPQYGGKPSRITVHVHTNARTHKYTEMQRKISPDRVCISFSANGSKVKGKRYSSPVTFLEWPRGFQEVKVPRLRDSGTGWW